MREFITFLIDASSACIDSTAALVLVATVTCLLINMHLRQGQWRARVADEEINASVGRIEHFMTVAQQNSVAVSCDPACAEIKARLAKLENMMTRVLVAVDKISSMKTSQCLSCNKLEILIARLIDATERHKPSQAVASESHSLPPRLEHRAQSSSDLVNYTTQPSLPVPGLTPYRQRQPRAQQDLSKGMSPSLGPMPSGKLPSDSQRKTQSRRRSCESAHSSNSVLTSPEFDTKWPMLDSPAVAQPTLFSEGRVHSDLPRAGSMPARKVDDSSRMSSDFPPYKRCTVDEALQLLNASPGEYLPNDLSMHV